MTWLTDTDRRALDESWDFGVAAETQYAAVERIVTAHVAAYRDRVIDTLTCAGIPGNPHERVAITTVVDVLNDTTHRLPTVNP